MIKYCKSLARTLFGAEVEFRARLFNLMMLSGIVFNAIMCVVKLHINSGDFLITAIAPGALSILMLAGLLWYVTKTGKYTLGNIVTVIWIFMIIVPVTYFRTGGYVSGHSSSFLGFIVFTAFILRGRMMVVFCVLIIILYTSLVAVAYKFPHTITGLGSEAEVAIDIGISIAVFGGILLAIIALHFRLYEREHAELASARRQMEDMSRLKQDIFTSMSHDMRTPLTIVSNYASLAVKQIRSGNIDEDTIANLETVSDEAKRLAEMADCALLALVSPGASQKSDAADLAPINISDIAESVIGLIKHSEAGAHLNISADIAPEAETVMGSAGDLTRLFWNLITNSVSHSHCDKITVRAAAEGGGDSGGDRVMITIEDDGTGIPPDILPRIWEIGIRGGVCGIGLSICRDIAVSHGGEIFVDSEVGKGTRVSVVLKKGEL